MQRPINDNQTPNLTITLNTDTYNTLVNILLAIHYKNGETLQTNENEISCLLSQILSTSLFLELLNSLFEILDTEIINQNF